MEMIKNKRILALVGIGCLFFGTFLPYIKFSFLGYSQTISLWGYWEGKIILILTLANALYIFKDFIEKYVPQLFNNKVGEIVEKYDNPKYSLVPTILVAAFAIFMLAEIDVSSEYLKYGLGFWTMWLGIIALAGHAILYKGGQTVVAPVSSVQPQPTQVQSTPMQTVQQPVQNVSVQPQVEPMQTVQQPVEQAQPQVSNKFCPNCGSQVAAGAEACHMCGTRF